MKLWRIKSNFKIAYKSEVGWICVYTNLFKCYKYNRRDRGTMRDGIWFPEIVTELSVRSALVPENIEFSETRLVDKG